MGRAYILPRKASYPANGKSSGNMVWADPKKRMTAGSGQVHAHKEASVGMTTAAPAQRLSGPIQPAPTSLQHTIAGMEDLL